MQAPFQHPDAIEFLTALKKQYKPTKIVCIGDSVDQHKLAKWTGNPDAPSAGDEYTLAMAFMHKLYKLFPVAVEVESNHNMRVSKRLLEAGIPKAYQKKYEEWMQYPTGWSIHKYVEIDGIMYEHGTRFGGANATTQSMQVNWQSTVFGHHPSSAGVTFRANRKQMAFGINVGCLINHDTYAFEYSRESKFMPTLGAGVMRPRPPDLCATCSRRG